MICRKMLDKMIHNKIFKLHTNNCIQFKKLKENYIN